MAQEFSFTSNGIWEYYHPDGTYFRVPANKGEVAPHYDFELSRAGFWRRFNVDSAPLTQAEVSGLVGVFANIYRTRFNSE